MTLFLFLVFFRFDRTPFTFLQNISLSAVTVRVLLMIRRARLVFFWICLHFIDLLSRLPSFGSQALFRSFGAGIFFSPFPRNVAGYASRIPLSALPMIQASRHHTAFFCVLQRCFNHQFSPAFPSRCLFPLERIGGFNTFPFFSFVIEALMSLSPFFILFSFCSFGCAGRSRSFLPPPPL